MRETYILAITYDPMCVFVSTLYKLSTRFVVYLEDSLRDVRAHAAF
jgi:hypothetical protein